MIVHFVDGIAADTEINNAIVATYGNLPVAKDSTQNFDAASKGGQSCNYSVIS